MDLISVGLLMCSVGVVTLTFLQQRKRSLDALEAQKSQLQQKEEVISEFKNLITGGDSYLFLRPTKVLDANKVLFVLEFKGKYPLYDTTILIEEFDLLHVADNNYQFQKSNQRSINLGTVNPLQSSSLFQVVIPEAASDNNQFGKRFFLKISSRNGMIEEDVYLRREGIYFSMAYKVVYFEPDYNGQFGGVGIGAIKRKVRHIDSLFPVHQLEHLNGDSGWKAEYEEQSGTGIN